MTETQYETVIGLEVHAQLLSKSKLFCSCSTEFNAPPNSNTCPVCLGLPGALPVLNREAVAMAVKAGLALGCRINQTSLFARKNYFYPDLPKGYQISQYDRPLATGGSLSISTQDPETGHAQDFEFGITRIHLEDDAGKSIHSADVNTYVNLNRTGVPLIEIVTEPDFRSPLQAFDFLTQLRQVLIYLAICDGNMEEGSLRCDANASVRERGASDLGVKTEIKNLNSFRFLKKALEYEIERQIRVSEEGGSIHQETRLWDENGERTVAMRSKEYAHDYRYFPEPDLLPVVIPDAWLEELESQIPELPEAKRRRFAKQYGLSLEEANLVTQTITLADFFEAASEASGNSRAVYNWMTGDLSRYLKRDNQEIADCRVTPQALGRLASLVESGEISGRMAKTVFEKMYESGQDPDTIVSRSGLQQISDQQELEAIVENILGQNLGKVAAYRAGKTGLLGFFMGQVMQATKGQANPQLVNQLLKNKLE